MKEARSIVSEKHGRYGLRTAINSPDNDGHGVAVALGVPAAVVAAASEDTKPLRWKSTVVYSRLPGGNTN